VEATWIPILFTRLLCGSGVLRRVRRLLWGGVGGLLLAEEDGRREERVVVVFLTRNMFSFVSFFHFLFLSLVFFLFPVIVFVLFIFYSPSLWFPSTHPSINHGSHFVSAILSPNTHTPHPTQPNPTPTLPKQKKKQKRSDPYPVQSQEFITPHTIRTRGRQLTIAIYLGFNGSAVYTKRDPWRYTA
jgi:hypothetical protein